MSLEWKRQSEDKVTAGLYTVTRFKVEDRRVYMAYRGSQPISREAQGTAKVAMALCERNHAIMGG